MWLDRDGCASEAVGRELWGPADEQLCSLLAWAGVAVLLPRVSFLQRGPDHSHYHPGIWLF